ncbi:hypothetical protein CEE45_10970 [Candidatus Heimdallarchaeota archaeon B3_Heim]|nr:MAG: hypothetical protein CEE45_10970 [Candidatus Heimdallarchaeota archaeon B3_Heim]
MITKIFIKNFKGFGEPIQEIPLNKITLIFGANSAGKTSIIQPLLLLKQTLEEASDPQTVLLPNGYMISLGNYREFVFKHETDREIFIGFEVDHKDYLGYQFNLKKNILSISGFNGRISSKKVRRLTRGRIKREYNFSGKRLKKGSYTITLDDIENVLAQEIDRTLQNLLEVGSFEEILSKKKYRNLRTYFIREMEKSDEKDPTVFINKMNDRFQDLKRHVQDYDILKHFTKEVVALENPLLLKIKDTRRFYDLRIKSDLDNGENFLVDFIREEIRFPYLYRLLTSVHDIFARTLQSLIFIGPLREEPIRIYTYSGNIPSTVGIEGEFTAEMLYYSQTIRDSINNKFKELDIKYQINVTPISEHENDIFRIKLTDQIIKTDVTITDVGFGLSQILPIIVQSYALEQGTIFIEQPEIHIHPKLQTELAQLFYERITENQNIQFIIETHSEHIILRLQRLIRKGLLNPSDISILYVTRENKGIACKQLKLNNKGNFIDHWPEGFFEEAFIERFG